MILAIDQGTTGTTCLVFDEQARLRSRAYREFTQHFPRPGWVEHDADEIWEVARAVAHEALGSAGIPRAGRCPPSGSPTSARPSSPGTNEPARPCTTRSCGRTAARPSAATSCARRGSRLVRERTGLVIDPYFSGTKIEWLLRSVPGCASGPPREAASGPSTRGSSLKLTGRPVTDWTNASRTMLFDIGR